MYVQHNGGKAIRTAWRIPHIRKRGIPKKPGDVTLRKAITQPGLSWKQLERFAKARRRWIEVVHDLCSRRSQWPK